MSKYISALIVSGVITAAGYTGYSAIVDDSASKAGEQAIENILYAANLLYLVGDPWPEALVTAHQDTVKAGENVTVDGTNITWFYDGYCVTAHVPEPVYEPEYTVC